MIRPRTAALAQSEQRFPARQTRSVCAEIMRKQKAKAMMIQEVIAL
jgi:succinylarginine dihydrolase